jgi:hypothetical protein
MTSSLRLAFSIVRAWTRVYTCGLPPLERATRRHEIESDLWEFQAETGTAAGIVPAIHTLLRLVAGVPDDLRWRIEGATRVPSWRALVICSAAGALAIVWIVASFGDARIPRVPMGARLEWQPASTPAPPPPPPPPPPCAHADVKTGCR